MSKIYHILNGDCLYDQLKLTAIHENLIIFRECLMDGPVKGDTLAIFWQKRAAFISGEFHVSSEDYYTKTVEEFEKIFQISDDDEVCLWFEHDLFCQVNMWFIISVLAKSTKIKIFRISPICNNEKELWEGFSKATPEMLIQAYQQRRAFLKHDIKLGQDLWQAFEKNDLHVLKELSKQRTDCFSMLEEVCEAHIDRFGLDGNVGKPEYLVRQILKQGLKPFEEVMVEFGKIGGIYGLGDLQLKKIYDEEIKLM